MLRTLSAQSHLHLLYVLGHLFTSLVLFSYCYQSHQLHEVRILHLLLHCTCSPTAQHLLASCCLVAHCTPAYMPLLLGSAEDVCSLLLAAAGLDAVQLAHWLPEVGAAATTCTPEAAVIAGGSAAVGTIPPASAAAVAVLDPLADLRMPPPMLPTCPG